MKPFALFVVTVFGFFVAKPGPSIPPDSSQLRSNVKQLSMIIAKLGQIDTSFYHYTRLISWPIEQDTAVKAAIGRSLFKKTGQPEWQQATDIRVISTMGRDIVAITVTAVIHVRDTIVASGDTIHIPADEEKYIPRTDLDEDVIEQLKNLAPPVSRIFELTGGSWGRESANSELSLNNDDKIVITKLNRYAANGVDHDRTTVISVRLPDKASFLYHNKWGLELRIGNEEMGYPFWTSGNMSALAIYNRIKLGVQAPFQGGRNEPEGIGKIWRPRRLEGTWGVTGECDFIDIGGTFSFGFRRTDINGTFINPDSIFVIRRMVQAWYSQTIGYNNKKNLLRLKVGFGFHQIGRDGLFQARAEVVNGSQVAKPSEILSAENDRTYWSPYLKAEYINQTYPELFGFSLQYYQEWALATVWLEIVPNVVRLEAKGGAPILRKHYPWEPSHFVTLTLPLTFWF